MSDEYSDRRYIVKLLKSLDAIPVENPARPGTPDINYKHGWIELKKLKCWPKRHGLVKIPHFSPQQRLRHIKRRAVGGLSFVLIRVDKDWVLLDGNWAAFYIGKADRIEILAQSIKYFQGCLPGKILLQYLASTHAD